MAGWEGDGVLDPPGLPEVLKTPPVAGDVLVLSPHADDETIGPGGTLLKHRDRGEAVDVLFLTSGQAGNADGRYDPDEYIRIRREEAAAACAALGVRHVYHWDYPDNYVVTEADMAIIVPRLVERVEAGGYAGVYTPHRGEIHTDHHVSSVLATRALASMLDGPALFGYEIWAPCTADIVVDVTDVFEEKLKIAGLYASQIVLNDIRHLFTRLNGYRACVLDDKEGFGEAFVRMGSGS